MGRIDCGVAARTGTALIAIGIILGIVRPDVAHAHGAQAGGNAPAPAPVPGLDLDKLFMISDKKFTPLANRLASFTRTRWQNNYCHVQFDQVLGGDRMWAPIERDASENSKSLEITARAGHPRKIRFSIKLQVSKAVRDGKPEDAKVQGRESLHLELIEHPIDKTLRLVLDPATFLKKQALLQGTWIEAEPKEGAVLGQDQKSKEEDSERTPKPEPGAAPQMDPGAEVTLVRSFKADDQSITIGFRRKASGLRGKVMDGTIKIDIDSTLSTTIYNELPDKKGKLARACVAFFHGGHRAPW